jgi:hypothetical protein
LPTKWRVLVSGLFADATFNPPCAASDLHDAEQQLKVKLPDELRAFYLETNGISASYGTSIVWPLAEMVAHNETFRKAADFVELYMPFDCLLFFGQEGNGDQFAYRILAGVIPPTSWIYEWDHETDNRVWFARDLADYFHRCAKPDGSSA